MQSRTLLSAIEEHPATHHPVFGELAKKRPEPARLSAFLHEMGAFCQASRCGGVLAQTLSSANMGDAGKAVAEIIDSEAGHGKDFAAMAVQLLGADAGDPDAWQDLRPRHAETQSACSAFLSRELAERRSALHALGVMLPLEVHANTVIIPGEVTAFVDSGFYGLTLDQVPYLAEHAGEHGAENIHQQKMLAAVDTLTDPADKEVVLRGCTEFLGLLGGFYDRLQILIASGTEFHQSA